MNGALLDIALANRSRTIAVVGTAKNAGKTTTFNALRAAAYQRGITGAITSIGRDGEAADALDGAPKPRIRIESGTIIALPRALIPRSPAFEIIDTGEPGPLGSMVFARVRYPTQCEIGGPPTARGVRATILRLAALTAGPTFVDGAIDRLAPLAGGSEAIVLAVGAIAGASVSGVADLARSTAARLRLRGRDAAAERREVVVVEGALDARDAAELLARGQALTVVVADPTRVAVRGKLFDRLAAALDLRCEHPLNVVACTTSTGGGGSALDPRALVNAVAAATGLPVFDVVAKLRA